MSEKILIIANHGVVIYKFRLELLEELISQNYEVYVSLPNDDVVSDLEKIGCKVIDTKVNRQGLNPIEDLKLLKKYIQIIKEVKPKIILTYTIKPNIYGGLAAQICQVPYIANITGLGSGLESNKILRLISVNLYRLAFRKIKTVFFQNKANLDFFEKRKIALGKYQLLPGSGVNLEQFTVQEFPVQAEKEDKFLFLGRIFKPKGINEFLEAARMIKEKFPMVEFHVAGFVDGNGYEEKIKNASKQNLIIYHGMVRDVHSLLQKCSCVVLSSYYEGMSNVLLEAAASGRPIIASDIPGCRETFDDGITGFACLPRNSDNLYAAMKKFINLPLAEKIEMGKKGRKKMERQFNRQIVVNRYLEEIKSL